MLGEDRLLSTLLLKTFPRRKMMFLPAAQCYTIVPDKFSVLLSQRRRWINSTVHNLMELVLVKDLCGTFCFSMQFIVAMELFGTLVLPAAIIFTFFLIYSMATPASSFVNDSLIPLILLITILLLPSILILVAGKHPSMFVYFLIYLAAIFIWNFVLPVYAYWHL
jgi:chitin synthase